MNKKTKKAAQIAKIVREQQRSQQAESHRIPPSLELPPADREEGKTFLIICEGSNTEPDYIKCLRKHFEIRPTVQIDIVGGAGETIRVVERAEEERAKAHYDEVWVVFDKDDFPKDHFDNAINKAKSLDINVAYSNQAFEYWLILHFEDHQGGGMHRKKYTDKINTFLHPLRFDGNGSKKITKPVFEKLVSPDGKNLERAIKRAKKICTGHEKSNDSPACHESSTTFFKLVEALLPSIKQSP